MAGFTISATALQLLTSRAALVVERRNTIPVLGQVLIKWGGGKISMDATDLDNQISLFAEAETDGWGSMAINPKHLGWLARSGASTVRVEHLESEGGNTMRAVRLTAGDISAKLNLICDAADFPELSVDGMQPPLQFTQGDLHRLITMGRSAISTEETRYYLHGVFLHGINGKARAVTTDGHRLARIDSEAPWWKAGPGSTRRREMFDKDKDAPKMFVDHGVIVPRKAAYVLSTLLQPGANEPVEMSVSDLKLSAAGPGWALKSKMIDGTYPSYERVIPTETPVASMTLSLASIRRVAESPFSTERSCAIKFDLSAGRASMMSPDFGEISAPIQASGDFTIGFNAAYVVGAVRALGGNARFAMTKPDDPALVYGEDPDALFVLMPMRV